MITRTCFVRRINIFYYHFICIFAYTLYSCTKRRRCKEYELYANRFTNKCYIVKNETLRHFFLFSRWCSRNTLWIYGRTNKCSLYSFTSRGQKRRLILLASPTPSRRSGKSSVYSETQLVRYRFAGEIRWTLMNNEWGRKSGVVE